VNAKTLSKALTDLAAEGILDRSIGRGTYVKGTTPVSSRQPSKWLILADPEHTDSPLTRELMQVVPQSKVISNSANLRPSFLNHFTAVIDCALATPESFYRGLIVRGIPIVAACDNDRHYSTHAVLLDSALAAFSMARDLVLAGHRRLVAIDPRSSTRLCDAIRSAISRYGPQATVDSLSPNELRALPESGATAIIASSVDLALRVRAELNARGLQIPAQVSLAAIGCAAPDVSITGYYVDWAQTASTIAQLLKEASPHRPAVLWLSPTFIDRGTTALPPRGPSVEPGVPKISTGLPV
jgi:DNA-binding LacI/PurR family transcriptional regulator